MNTALKVTKLNIELNYRQILKDVSFAVPANKITYVIGANGSGKTTLIKTILGLNQQNSGTISIFGAENNQKTISELVGYVPQYSLIDRDFPITVREMIQLDCDLSHRECHVDITDHLRMLGAEKLLDRKISQLSGGEFQKVLLARSLTNEHAKLVIMDEPFSNLDHNAQHDLMDLIHKANKELGKTLLIISHDYHIINNKSDYVLFILDGKVMAGEADKILAHEHIHF